MTIGLGADAGIDATMPPPPVLFSITTPWPHRLESCCARKRAARSVMPPGANGTMIRTGRSGNPEAPATPVSNQPAASDVQQQGFHSVLLWISLGGLGRRQVVLQHVSEGHGLLTEREMPGLVEIAYFREGLLLLEHLHKQSPVGNVTDRILQ